MSISKKNSVEKKKKKIVDRGHEYESSAFNSFVQCLGIIHETIAPCSPASNGVAKRKNRTLIELTNAMLIESGAPLHFWGETILTACQVLNRVPYKKSHTTPFEIWKGYKPNLGYLTVWDCLAYVRFTDPKMSKLGIRAFTSTFLGYAINSVTNKFFLS